LADMLILGMMRGAHLWSCLADTSDDQDEGIWAVLRNHRVGEVINKVKTAGCARFQKDYER